MILGRQVLGLACAVGLGAGAAMAEVTHQVIGFDDLVGWADDDHAAALTTFQETCADMDDPDWLSLCALSRSGVDPRGFFELFFRPVVVNGHEQALFTGYFEPELDGARRRSDRFSVPVYRKPPEAAGRWLTREEIETGDTLIGRGLEIAWVDDPVALFFLQVQGSGRITLPDGSSLRVGYGGNNGHPYRSIGAELIRRGTYAAHQVSAQVIANWVRRNPKEGRALLHHNPSYVFFRELSEVPAHKGPLGAMNRSITPMRSIAIDPAFTPLGAPVWIEKAGSSPMNRLMIAQDTGSAIKGAQRADIFYGTGAAAGRQAGRIRDPGRIVVLLPIDRAWQLAPEG